MAKREDEKSRKQTLDKWREHHDYEIAKKKIDRLAKAWKRLEVNRGYRNNEVPLDGSLVGYEDSGKIYIIRGKINEALSCFERAKVVYTEHMGIKTNTPDKKTLEYESIIDALETIQKKEQRKSPKDSDLSNFLGVIIGCAFLLVSLFLSVNTITGFVTVETISRPTTNYLSIGLFLIGTLITLISLKNSKK